MPQTASCITVEQRQRIAQVVSDVEANTVAEIVPAVAQRSGRYDRAEGIVGFWLALVVALLFWWIRPREAPTPGSWTTGLDWVGLLILAGAMVAALVLGTWLTARCDWLAKLFTPARQMRHQVQAAARKVFFDRRVHHADSACGMLIYVSLFERTAVMLADEKVLEAVGQDAIDTWCAQLIESLKSSEVIEALCGVIETTGEPLADKLPRDKSDKNELADVLVLL